MKPFSRCVIVTPTFNSQGFLDDTIASVLLQTAPDVAIDYHIQDGGSTDGTEAIVRAWIARIENGALPRMARSLRLTWASARDRGMYDAINLGMATLAPGPQDIVTWINSDDRIAPGAIATVAQVFADHPTCEFLSGRTALLNEAGSIVSITYPQAYTRDQLAAGAHDGRAQAFIMQEGTFFTGRVWAAVGGVDPAFRLAGDWDLWRRMAREAAHFSLDTVTAFHRRRAGQLSSDMASYHAEVDAHSGTPGPPVPQTPPQLIRYDPDTASWISTPFDALASRPPIAVVDGRRRPSCAVCYLGGFGAPEGPYPEYRLPSGVRWLRERSAEVAVDAPYDGEYRITLTLRPTAAKLRLRVFCNGLPIVEAPLASPVPDTDQLIAVPAWLGIGRNVIELEIVGDATEPRVLLLVDCTVVAEADRGVEAPRESPTATGDLARAIKGMAVVVTAGTNPTRLAETIVSVRDAAGPGLVVRVAPGTDAAGVVEALVPHARRIAPDEGSQDERLRGEGYRSVLEIAAGETLRPATVLEAQRALREDGAAGVAGLVDLLDDSGAIGARLLPDGSKPVLRDLHATGRTVTLPLAIVTRHGAAPEASVAPLRIAVIDHAAGWHPARPLFALAGALRMLGIDVRYLIEARPDTGELVVAAGGALAGAADFVAAISGRHLILTPRDGGAPIMLPCAIDAEAFRPRPRASARAALELPADAFLVLAEPGHVAATKGALPPGARIATLADVAAEDTIALPQPTDPDIAAHLISAFDVVVADAGAWLALAAAACGVPALDASGAIAGSPEPGPGLPAALRRLSRNRAGMRVQAAEARAAVERTATLEALALALHQRAFSGCADRTHLAAGAIDLPTDAPLALEPAVAQHRGFALTPLRGARVENDPGWGHVLRLGAPEAVLLLRVEDLSGTALRLHVAGPEGSHWTIQVDDEPSSPLHLSQPVTTARVAAPLPAGLHRVTLRAINAAARAGASATRIVAWEVVSTRAGPARETERTRVSAVPVAGRRVATLARDGDWVALDGFLKLEEPHPAAGLHAPFRWTHGDHAALRLRNDRGGARAIELAMTAIAAGQRLRLVVDGAATAWSEPLLAYVGRVSHVRWPVDWPAGDLDVRIELADRPASGNPRDLGVLILGITLS